MNQTAQRRALIWSAVSVFAFATGDVRAQAVQWNLDRIDQRALPLSRTYQAQDNLGGTYTGAGVQVYIFDYDIHANHSQLQGRLGEGYQAHPVTRGRVDFCDHHGTHVAGIVGALNYGVANGVTLHSVKVYPCITFVSETIGGGNGDPGTVVQREVNDGTGWPATVDDLVKALNWIRTNQLVNHPRERAVVNISQGLRLSTITNAQKNNFTRAINELIDAGIVVVVAAGNDNADACNSSPSNVTRAIRVGASAKNDSRWVGSGNLAGFASNWGSCVDLFAPGENIRSLGWTPTTVSPTRTLSGTSQAAPHVAGVAALYLEKNPTMTVAEVKKAILDSATTGALSDVGAGSPNKLLYFGREGVFPAARTNRAPAAVGDNLGDVYVGDNMTIFPLRNDSDPDRDSIRIVDVTQPPGGRVSIENNGSELYLVPGSGTGSAGFRYTVTDGRGGVTSAVVRYRMVN